MAIRCTGFDIAYKVASFVADTPDDINNPDLPNIDKKGEGDFINMSAIGMGSDITVISPAQVWMLGSDGVWKEL